MANQLKVEIIADEQRAGEAVSNFEHEIVQAERRLQQFGKDANFGEDIARQVERAQRETLTLQKSFNSIHGPTGTFDLLTRDAQRAQARSFQVQQELARIQKQIARGGSQTFLDELAGDAVKAEAAIKRLEQEELRLQIRSASRRPGATGGGSGPRGSGSDVGGDIASGLGIPLGTAAVVGAGTALFVSAMHSAIAAAREGADANRVLSASATEAGFSYDLASEKTQNFARQTGLSDTQAKQTFSSLLQVAKVAGQTDDIDNIQNRFADLAAARGVAAQDLTTLAQQILSGQDEALNRIGLADPSKLAADWAAAHGRTVESMTQAEQVASRLDAVMRKGAMFDGSAEARLHSVSGQMEVTEQSLNNLTKGVGESILNNMEFRDLLSEINGLLHSISLSSDDVRNKLKQGLTPQQIAQEAVGDNKVLDSIKGGLSAVPASLLFLYDAAADDVETAQNRFYAALNPGERRAKEVEELVKNQQKDIENQKKAAEDQKRINEEKAKADADRIASQQAANVTIKNLQTAISHDESLNGQIAGIRHLRDEIESFGRSGALAATDVKEKIASLDEQLFQTQKRIEELVRSTFKETRTFLDDMSQRVNKDNPFVTLFQQTDTVMQRTRDRFGAFGDDFVQQMARVENQALEMEKIALRIQSSQKVIDIQGEIAKLQFGPTGASAEDQRRLAIYDKQIGAARDIPGLEAQARAIDQAGYGRGPAAIDQGAILRKQIDEILKLKTQFYGETGYGDRGARTRIDQELISLFQSATPQMQAQLIQRGGRGFRGEIAGAYRDQAQDRRQAIEDEVRRAEAGRFVVNTAQKKLTDLQRYGGFDNDEVRKQYLAVTGSLSENELTPELRRGRVGALETEAKKEAEKEKQAAEDRKKLNAVLDLIKVQLTGKGIKVDQAGAGVLVEIQDKSDRASVTGPAFNPEQARRDMQL
jgi:hypothetical protein